MGTRNGIYGKMHIPVEKRELWAENMLKLMRAGGMMQFSIVKIFGKKIDLLKDLSFGKKVECIFYYNYIMDDSWESVSIGKQNGYFESGSVGLQQFGKVVFAGYLLGEFYSDNYCLAYEHALV